MMAEDHLRSVLRTLPPADQAEVYAMMADPGEVMALADLVMEQEAARAGAIVTGQWPAEVHGA